MFLCLTVAQHSSASLLLDLTASRHCHRFRIGFHVRGGGRQEKPDGIAIRGKFTFGHIRQEYLSAMQRLAARAGLVGTFQRTLCPSQLVVRRLWLWLRNHSGFSGSTENRGLARRLENTGDF